jgi:inner membrane protein
LDTATHFVMGLGLAGLAYTDPVVATDPALQSAVMFGTVIAAQAPDLDGVTRLKSSAFYIKNHRGITHSIPAGFLWSFAISGILYAIYGMDISYIHLWMWTFISVFVHIFIDLFNAYGTQVLRPFSEKWVAWNIIYIFDPYIFGSHVIALILWLAIGVPPAPLFTLLYIAFVLYLITKTWIAHSQTCRLRNTIGAAEGTLSLIPTMRTFAWNVIWDRPHEVKIGESNKDLFQWVEVRKKKSHPAIDAARKHPDIQAFLYFTHYAVPDINATEQGFEVRWYDVRYRNRKHYPFIAAADLNSHLEVTQTFVGWVYNEDKIEQKLKASSPPEANV